MYHTLPMDDDDNDDKIIYLLEAEPTSRVSRKIKAILIGVLIICTIMWLLKALWMAYFLQGVTMGKEYADHAAHNPVKSDHYTEGEHNKDFDHEAVLGEYNVTNASFTQSEREIECDFFL